MLVQDSLREKREEVLRLAARYGAYNVRVFGSVARQEANAGSDIDLLVDLKPECGLEYVALWQELQDLLGREVDLVTEASLHWYIRDQVLKEAVPL